MSPLRSIVPLDGVAVLIDRFDLFLLDLWGTVHDGVALLPYSRDVLHNLKAANKTIVLLSNAPRRAATVEAQLESMGLERSAYDHVVTSGEDLWLSLRDRPDEWYQSLGSTAYFLGPDRDRAMADGNGVTLTGDPAKADFILGIGMLEPLASVEAHEDVLHAGVDAGIPLLCANPDLEVTVGGRHMLCNGALAARYQALGGAVRYHGKPTDSIYRRCLELASITQGNRVVALGDGLTTDIAGANAAELASVLVTGGLPARTLGLKPEEFPPAVQLERLCNEAGAWPDYVMVALRW